MENRGDADPTPQKGSPFFGSGVKTERIRSVSLRVRLFAFAALAMTLVIGERTFSLARLYAEDLAAGEKHVAERLNVTMGGYNEALAAMRATLVTLASDVNALQPGLNAPLPPAAAAGSSAPVENAGNSPSAAECASLTRVAGSINIVETLSLVDTDGIVRCSSRSASVGLDLSGRDYFRIAMRGITSIEPVRRRLISAQPAIFAAQPITLESGEVVGVLVARVNLRALFPESIFTDLGPNTDVILVSPEGVVMETYPSGRFAPGHDLSNSPAVARAMTNTRGTLLAEGPDGIQRIFAYARLPDSNMHLLVGVEQNTVLGPAERATWRAGLTIIVASILILGGLWLAGERLVVAPVQALADRLIRFGHGEIESTTSTVVITELEPLTKAFEGMARELTRRETALRSANRRLNSLASLDPLTGIANRRSFDAILALQWNSSSRLSMLILDIDSFKLFNDHYGHKEGDRCIRAVAQTLSSTVRNSDMVARVGGEEFAVLMPNAELSTATEVAERLRRAVEGLAIPHIANILGHVTISVGCASCQPSAELSPSSLYVAADRALYEAKHAGRNTVRASVNLAAADPAKDVETVRAGRAGGATG